MLEEGDSRLEGFDLHLPKPVLGPDLEEIVAKAMVLRDSRLDLRRIQPGTTGRQSASLHLSLDREGVLTRWHLNEPVGQMRAYVILRQPIQR